MLYDRRVSSRGKVLKTAMSSAMPERQEPKTKVAEIKMCFSLEATRLDEIKNGYTRGTLHMCRFSD